MQMPVLKNFSFCTFFHQLMSGYPHAIFPQAKKQFTTKPPEKH